MFHHFTQLVEDASGWAYAIVLVLAFLDVLIPVVPSETSVITAGVVASTGALSLPLVVAAAALGAFAGDNTAYFIGWKWGNRVNERFFTSDKARERIRWAERQLEERGGELIIVGRFIPGGRTAITLTAGTLEYPWRRFVVFDAIAVTGWALYAALLGYVGGHAFEQDPWKGLIVALLIGFALAGAVELVRWIRRRRSKSARTS